LSRALSGDVIDATSIVNVADSSFDAATTASPVTPGVRPLTVSGEPRRTSSTRYPACVRLLSSIEPATTDHVPLTSVVAACD
jgi:hypothetical protein